MASSIGRAMVAAACLLLLAAAGAPSASAFDPPFDFPALQRATKVHGAVPTENDFVKGCFSYVYGLLHQAGKELYKKPAELPDTVMKSCRQEDKKGCHRFAQQLQQIVEHKEKEGPIGHMRHAKAKAAEKVQKVEKVDKAAEQVKQIQNVETKAQKVEKVEKVKKVEKVEKPKPASPPAHKHHKHKPGARVKAEDLEEESFIQLDAAVIRQPLSAFAQDFANFDIDGASAVAEGRKSVQQAESLPSGLAPDFALLGLSSEVDGDDKQKVVTPTHASKPAVQVDEKKHLGLVAQEAQRRPLRYTEWCTNLYAAATATYDPKKAAKSPAAPEKSSVAAPSKAPTKASPKATTTNATATKDSAVPKAAPAKNATVVQAAPKAPGHNATAVKAEGKAVPNVTKA
jgi:hypothetical protein